MKKLVLSLALVAVASLAFGQKKVVKEAEKGFKSGNLAAALVSIDGATTNPETSADPSTFMVKAQIHTKIFSRDSSNTMETLKAGNEALETFNKTFEMAGSNKTTPVGKEVYADEVQGLPDNLRPYSLITLMNISLDKAIERYNEQDMEMSYEFFNFAGEIDKTDTSTHYNAGILANELGRFEDAKKHFGYLLEIPEYNKTNAYYTLIPILSTEEKNPEAAYAMVTKARAEYPENKILAEYEIQLLLQLKKMDVAMAQIRDALANDPNNTNLWLRSGYLKEQGGDLEAAMADYKKSVEVDPNFFDGNYYAGGLLLQKARNILADLNSLPDDQWEKMSPEMGKQMNEIHLQSLPYFLKTLEIKPDDTDIMKILYDLFVRVKNNVEAENMNKKLSAILGPKWQEN